MRQTQTHILRSAAYAVRMLGSPGSLRLTVIALSLLSTFTVPQNLDIMTIYSMSDSVNFVLSLTSNVLYTLWAAGASALGSAMLGRSL